jgi:S-adenosylmethionine uptake transporter
MPSLWMLFASAVFSVMGVCVKLASELYSTHEILMYRGLTGVVFLFALARWQGGSLRTPYPWHHAWRGVVGVVALWLWFYALGKLPLGTSMTLNYMSPIWIAAILFGLGWWRGQKRFEGGLSAAILCSFAGVTLLLRPSFQADQWFAGTMGLMSGVVSAFAYLQVRSLGQMGEPEYRVVFYFSLTGVITGLLGALGSGENILLHHHSGKGLALLLAIGVTATVAQLAMTRAYRLGNTLVTANLQYTGIVFSSVLGILIWGDVLDLSGWIGIAMILVSGVGTSYYSSRNAGALVVKKPVVRRAVAVAVDNNSREA